MTITDVDRPDFRVKWRVAFARNWITPGAIKCSYFSRRWRMFVYDVRADAGTPRSKDLKLMLITSVVITFQPLWSRYIVVRTDGRTGHGRTTSDGTQYDTKSIGAR